MGQVVRNAFLPQKLDGQLHAQKTLPFHFHFFDHCPRNMLLLRHNFKGLTDDGGAPSRATQGAG